MLKHSDLTDQILSAFYAVYNVLGYGFAERVYHEAMAIELRRLGMAVASEKPLPVHYRGILVGDFAADLVVDDAVLLELKAVRQIADEHRAQILNYLRASRYEVGLLLNFGPQAQFERKVFDNEHKGQSAAHKKPETSRLAPR